MGMWKVKTKFKKGFGRFRYFKKSGARLYIPEKILKDKNFPFSDKELVQIEIEKNSLKVRSVEWWEMLKWSQMKEAFDKLPLEIKEKIKPHGDVESEIQTKP